MLRDMIEPIIQKKESEEENAKATENFAFATRSTLQFRLRWAAVLREC
jgi:hypothetical protein